MNSGLDAKAFAEELKELLGEVEELLKRLGEHPDDSDLIVRVFRALHAIRGSGTIFGFDEIADLTREVEAAFDAIRTSGNGVVPRDLLDKALVAQGKILGLIDSEGGKPTSEAVPVRFGAVGGRGERILVVDADEEARLRLAHNLGRRGFFVTAVGTYVEALAVTKEDPFDLAFVDIRPDDRLYRQVIRLFEARNPFGMVILTTPVPTVETAAEAVRLGAFDYIPKPIPVTNLLHATDMAITRMAVVQEREEHRLHMEGIIHSVQDALITVDRELIVSSVNAAARKHFGISESLVGHPFTTVSCANVCLEALTRSMETRCTETVNRVEWRLNGTNQVITLTASPLMGPDDVFRGGVLTLRDETRLDDLERTLSERQSFHHIIGKSEKMRQVYALIEKLADVESSVLITGETGTGKELVAEALHYGGRRRYKSLVKVNCSALPDTLLESELFGHVKGAFTGAVGNKAGRFENAHGGTLFLDEIGDIPANIQVKLLRAIQEKSFEKVGASQTIKVDVRIVTATNRDLVQDVRDGHFREDLFYRLKVVEIHLPALRERREDIPLLTSHFLKAFNEKFGKNVETVSRDVQKIFLDYPWPGNVRQLQHAIERGVLLCSRRTLTTDDLPPEIRLGVVALPPGSPTAATPSEDAEEALYRRVLETVRWNKTRAAQQLNVSRQTLYRKMRRYGLNEP